MKTKTATLLSAVLLSAIPGAQAGEYDYLFSTGFQNSGNIPDGSLSGWSDTETLSGIAGDITSVSVTLNVTGGYNGDLYAYLNYNGNTVVLLNRVGVGTGTDPTYSFGYSGAGFNNLVLQDGAINGDIHAYGGGVGTGTYSPDGRNVSPLSSPSVLYGTSRATLNGTFGGMSPNSGWTLFIADVSAGGGQSQLTSWGLEINVPTQVPEPGTLALGGVALAGFIARQLWGRQRSRA